MKKPKAWLFSILFLMVTSFADCEESRKVSHKFVDKNFIGITIGTDFLIKLETLFGKGVVDSEGDSRCYFNPSESAYIVFVLCEDNRICSVLVSKDKSLWEECEKALIRIPMQTGKGIKIGDTREEIILTYGPPQKKEASNGFEIESFEYHTTFEKDVDVNLYYDSKFDFDRGKLIRLFIHDGS